jgi:hypothetical protein
MPLNILEEFNSTTKLVLEFRDQIMIIGKAKRLPTEATSTTTSTVWSIINRNFFLLTQFLWFSIFNQNTKVQNTSVIDKMDCEQYIEISFFAVT